MGAAPEIAVATRREHRAARRRAHRAPELRAAAVCLATALSVASCFAAHGPASCEGVECPAGTFCDASGVEATCIAPTPTVLLAPDGAADELFGIAVALSSDGTRALVGSESVATVSGTGSARVFSRAGVAWTEEAVLVQPGTSGRNDFFGRAVALDGAGARALVGAPGFDDPSTFGDLAHGRALVFVRTGTSWTLEAELDAPDDTVGFEGAFGAAVGLSTDGEHAIVGAPGWGHDMARWVAGSAHVFARAGAGWVEEAVLPASGERLDNFGVSVALSSDGSRALVGSPGWADIGGFGSPGSARVFARAGSAWSEEGTLAVAGASPGDPFGASVALDADGGTALVGEPAGYRTGASIGRIFVRTDATWREESPALAVAEPPRFFAYAVALTADATRALVGGLDRVDAFDRAGSSWTGRLLVPEPATAAGSRYGTSLALSADGRWALVGAPSETSASGARAGTVRVFPLLPPR